jgi:hypothetical protein
MTQKRSPQISESARADATEEPTPRQFDARDESDEISIRTREFWAWLRKIIEDANSDVAPAVNLKEPK